MSERGALALLLVVCAAAVLAFGRLVPRGQGPDEEAHLSFVRVLAGQESATWRLGLPVLDTGVGQPPGWDPQNFEVHQPPLYYALSAPGYCLLGTAAPVLLSLLAVLATVWLTWRLVREVASGELALAAAATVALWPQVQFLGSRVNNDSLANALAACVLWRLVRTLVHGPSAREGQWVGLGLGLALLTKQTALVLVPLVVLAPLLTRQWRAAGVQVAWSLGVALALAGWWFGRNLAVYGDCFAQRAFDERFCHRAHPADIVALLAKSATWSGYGYWAYVRHWTLATLVIQLGGGTRPVLAEGLVPVQAALWALAALGSAVAVARRTPDDPARRSAWLLGVGLVLLSGLYAQFNTKYFQAQGRYFFLLLPALATLLCAGLGRVWPAGSPLRRYGLLVAPLWHAFLGAMLFLVFLPGLFET